MSFSSDIKHSLSAAEIKRDCCRTAYERGRGLLPFVPVCERDLSHYLRGVFVKCGSVSAPGRNFMLSLSLPDEAAAETVAKAAESAGLPAKSSVRRGKPVLYYKAGESIEDFLSYIGATKAALDIISSKVMSDVRNNTNRICNAETANLDRTAIASAEQCEAIRYIVKRGAMNELPPELRECAELRLENPDMPLSKLAELFREPVSKSGINHRLKKLAEFAEFLKSR